ncbi:hypothetical protein [Acinetobacter dispersus]|uniref:hypothetical protein n=1 Tax=Acinetobacter dispersus TaxID=70348 RepID=UPI001F4A1170|nr:hypothetical protein [Acinetobacter dispersus]MCH7391813.1 hypothetical protein [Acinetobacter dispersus]
MVSPIDYRLDVVDPFTQAMQGYQLGMQATVTNNAIQAQKAEEERQKQAEIQKQVMNEDLYKFSIIPNKTAEDYANIIGRYPTLAEPYQKAWNMMDNERQKQTLGTASQVYAALSNGSSDVAKQILDEQIKGYDNSGMKQEAFHLRNISKLIDNNPQAAQASIGMLMSSANPEQFKNITDSLNANKMQPYDIAKKQAETGRINAETGDIPLAAEDRRTGVRNQGRKIELDNQYNYDKLGQDNQQFFESLDNQQKVEARKMQATKNESSTQKMARLEKAQSFVSTAQNAAGTAKLAAELINDYKKLADASGAGVWNAAMRNIPGTAEYDFAKRVDTLKSQAFLIGAQSLKGLGAMTEMEGKKVTDALGNLDLSQSTKQVAEQLAAIARSANSVAQNANKNAQNYATKGQGYSPDVINAARSLGISPAEAQKFVNDNGL